MFSPELKFNHSSSTDIRSGWLHFDIAAQNLQLMLIK